jgi:CBS domain-containing membrane protein
MAKIDPEEKQCPAISDSDIFAAMKEIQGYLDITPSDLKEIYRHAFRHAHERIHRPIKAAEIMTTAVHHVSVDTPLKEVAELMARAEVSGVPVLDAAGRVAGVISEKDFLRRMGAPDATHLMSIVAAWLNGKGFVALPTRAKVAADIMAAPAITVRADSSAIEIMDLFTTRNINRVPVLDDSGKLAGIVSRADIIRAQATPRE